MQGGTYYTKIPKLHGTQWSEIVKPALAFYKEIKRSTRRRPYVRSVYFGKQKVFLELFWHHLYEKKNLRDKIRRVRFFPCAIDLVKHTHEKPISKENPNRKGERVHRFAGITQQQEIFFVQIKEVRRTGEKWLMSVFPKEK